MKSGAERCARTDAVLAVHLDGDFAADELAPSLGPESSCRPDTAADDRAGNDPTGWGWEFVCGESLREHLAGCTICQRALLRARRLDAVLAADAGRAVADLLGADGLGTALVERALRRATGAPTATAAKNDAPIGTPTGTPIDALADVPSCTPGSSRAAAWSAAALLGAAAMAAWWLLLGDRAPTPPMTTRPVATASTDRAASAATARDGGDQHLQQRATTAAKHDGATAFPLEAARRFARARQRDVSAERGPSPEQLAMTLADRDASADRRITAGAQLTQLSRASGRDAKACTDALLRALAGCGDASEAELEVQRTLLPQLRTAPLANVLLQRLQPLLTGEAGDAVDAGGAAPDLDTTAALVVALRAGGERLDAALRRVLRTRPDLDAIVTQALRCPTRDDGGAHLLLTCWQDRVATGHQADTPQAALHWFAGMSPATFATVRAVLETSRSSPERLRCLLALGCVGDDSTTACLLATLRSGHRLEACAASAALSSLPHDVLRPLVPLARRGGGRRSDGRGGEEALLRVALCRAGLDEAAPWLAALELTDRQRDQLRDAPLTRFSEIAGWFRDAGTIAD